MVLIPQVVGRCAECGWPHAPIRHTILIPKKGITIKFRACSLICRDRVIRREGDRQIRGLDSK